MELTDGRDLIAKIGRVLAEREPKNPAIGEDGPKTAGVLVPLAVRSGRCRVLFTQRTDEVAHHKGQISFPGGALEDGDASVEDAVLREVYEEIGLPAEEIQMLGRLDAALTVTSNFIIHPFVGLVPHAHEFVLNQAEVSRLITVPLEVFHPRNSAAVKDRVDFEGQIIRGRAYEYRGDVIWGATAGIMENLANMVFEK